MSEQLLSSSLLVRLERLSILSKRRVRGTMQGKRRSGRFGSSLEFADYREYTPGDDIRRFDWGVYARTGKPFIRQYWDEQELLVSLYVDISASMDYGGASRSASLDSWREQNKLWYAKRLAASVGYIALSGHDRVQSFMFSSGLDARLPVMRGKAAAARLFLFFQQMESQGIGHLGQALCHPSALPKQPGMTWIFSDLWLDGGLEELEATLSYFLAAGQEIVLVHMLSSEEMDPQLSGDLRLLDMELGTGKEVALTGKVLERYRQALDEYQAEISRFCNERSIYYVPISTAVPLEKGIFKVLRSAGVIGN